MTTHRLNHHDILAIEAFNARVRARAATHRRAERIEMAACALVLIVLATLAVTGGLPQ